MPGRTGCCKVNLCKIHPTTGATIWKRFIPGSGRWNVAGSVTAVCQIEPLRGTNDIIAIVSNTVSTQADVVRIDENGNQVWFYSGVSYWPINVWMNNSFRVLGADGSHIAVGVATTGAGGPNGHGIVGLNYSGSVIWSALPLVQFSGEILLSSQGIQVQRLSPNPDKWQLLDASNGSLVSTGTQARTIGGGIYAARQSDGYFVLAKGDQGGAVFGSVILTAGGAAIDVAAPPASSYGLTTVHRWNSTNIITTAGSSEALIQEAAGMPVVWNATSVLGSTPKSVACDNNSSGCYFTGPNAGSPANVTTYKRNNSTGAIIWGATPPLAGGSGSGISLAVADDGNVYVGGQV